MRLRATLTIEWESDDPDPEVVQKQYQDGEFGLDDLFNIADTISLKITNAHS